MTLPRFVRAAVFFASAACGGAALHAASLTGQRPNIVSILTDDQGYGDVAAHGNPVLKTPHLDRLHRKGVRFTDFNVSPTCSPTRSALHTGRHEFKNGVTHTVHERERLTLDAVTVTDVLKTAGYTTGIFGKWHLGDEDAYQPEKRGCDEVFIHGSGGIGQKFGGSSGDAPANSYFSPLVKHNGCFVKTDVRTDYAEQHDHAAQQPQRVADMARAYEAWWQSVVPLMVNESVATPTERPFWTLYQKQFGRLPEPEASPAEPKSKKKSKK